jgi:hypothetical protein
VLREAASGAVGGPRDALGGVLGEASRDFSRLEAALRVSSAALRLPSLSLLGARLRRLMPRNQQCQGAQQRHFGVPHTILPVVLCAACVRSLIVNYP